MSSRSSTSRPRRTVGPHGLGGGAHRRAVFIPSPSCGIRQPGTRAGSCVPVRQVAVNTAASSATARLRARDEFGAQCVWSPSTRGRAERGWEVTPRGRRDRPRCGGVGCRVPTLGAGEILLTRWTETARRRLRSGLTRRSLTHRHPVVASGEWHARAPGRGATTVVRCRPRRFDLPPAHVHHRPGQAALADAACRCGLERRLLRRPARWPAGCGTVPSWP